MKRHPHLHGLSSDHHHALVWAKRAREAAAADVDADRLWVDLSAWAEDDLAAHFSAEEQVLLPAMAAAGASALVDRTLAEHRQIRAALAATDGPAGERLARVGELLRAHVRFEERELLPAAEERLDEAALARVRAVAPPPRGAA